MADAAENLDSLESNDGAWKEALAGDNTEVLESLNQYESPDKFLEEFNSLKNHDWRDDFAGDDMKFKSTLERFKSPMEFSNSWREAQQKIRGGELQQQKGLPQPDEGATEEQIKAFREEQGIPLESKGYYENLPDGLVLGENDIPYFESFAEKLFEKNMPPEFAHMAIEWYNDFSEREQTALVEGDATHRQEMEDSLREEWGPDYRANRNLLTAYLTKSLGEDAHEAFINARGLDGRGIMNNKDVISWLTSMARQENPALQLIKGDGDPLETLNAKIAEIEKFMETNRTDYNKDEAMQAELRRLYDMRLAQK